MRRIFITFILDWYHYWAGEHLQLSLLASYNSFKVIINHPSLNAATLFFCVCRHQPNGGCLRRKNIDGLVSANELRWFWVQWTSSSVAYGRGSRPEQDTIIRYYNHRTLLINNMKIRSYADDEGFWIIPRLHYVSGKTQRLFFGCFAKQLISDRWDKVRLLQQLYKEAMLSQGNRAMPL